MTNVIAESFHVVIFILKFCGLYHDGNRSVRLKIRTYVLYFSGVLTSILTVIKLILEENKDIMQINQMVIFFTVAASGYLKLVSFLIDAPRLKKCIEFFGNTYKAVIIKNSEEKRILDDCLYVCRRNVNIYISVITFTGVCWNVIPLFDRKYRLPVNIWLPYEPTKRPVVFYVTYFYVVAAYLYYTFVRELGACCNRVVFYLGLASTMIEPLLGGLVYHARGQLKILKYNLGNLIDDDLKKSNKYSVVIFEAASEVLRQCILHHNNILE
ncbi:uncharacterized protein LOC135134659 [Zophobas morio]|uniref:uncharacterized protein LOC135134659 n=1 Tax=Zophobas morio TaxID=2755281 RepID=UPI003083489F